MSGKVQSLDSIAPMAQTSTTSDSDPVKVEYEQGKKSLEDGNLGQAAVALHNALVGFEEKKDENGIANAANQLGHLCLEKKEYETALKHYSRAYEICDKSNDRMSMLSVMKCVVKAQQGLTEYNKAIEVCLDMLDLYHDNRDPQGSVNVLEVMAELYLEMGDNGKAADSYRTIASIHKNFKHEKMASDYLAKADDLG